MSDEPKLICGRHGEMLDLQGECPRCSSLRSGSESKEERRRRMLFSIARSAEDSHCDWRAVDGAARQAAAVGIAAEEIEAYIEERYFRHEAPLIELSVDETQAVSNLEKAGLECMRNTTGPFRHGFTIVRPKKVPGNSRYSYRDNNSDDSDAPVAWVYPFANRKWYFEISCYAGAAGPGDFVNEHETLAGALEDVLDYYFGDPSRMNPPELADVDQLRANGKYRGW